MTIVDKHISNTSCDCLECMREKHAANTVNKSLAVYGMTENDFDWKEYLPGIVREATGIRTDAEIERQAELLKTEAGRKEKAIQEELMKRANKAVSTEQILADLPDTLTFGLYKHLKWIVILLIVVVLIAVFLRVKG